MPVNIYESRIIKRTGYLPAWQGLVLFMGSCLMPFACFYIEDMGSFLGFGIMITVMIISYIFFNKHEISKSEIWAIGEGIIIAASVISAVMILRLTVKNRNKDAIFIDSHGIKFSHDKIVEESSESVSITWREIKEISLEKVNFIPSKYIKITFKDDRQSIIIGQDDVLCNINNLFDDLHGRLIEYGR